MLRDLAGEIEGGFGRCGGGREGAAGAGELEGGHGGGCAGEKGSSGSQECEGAGSIWCEVRWAYEGVVGCVRRTVAMSTSAMRRL